MKFEKTIQCMFNNYPMLFQKRQECLNHLFCVVGNGYEWVNGELINNKFITYNSKTYEIEDINEPNIILKGVNKAIQTIESEGYNYLNFHGLITREWYPLCKEYSNLFNYPSNIKKDWLKGIEETKQLLISDDININL